MGHLYNRDLAHIHAFGFASSAERAAPEIVQVLKSAPIQIRRVIDVGCGAGPLTRVLCGAGFDVTGIDSSEELLRYARKAAPAARFVNASAYDAELGSCDAILAINERLTFHAEDVDADHLIREFFQRACEALPVRGMLIFDVIELGEPSLAGRFWASGDDWAVLVDTTEDQADRILVRDITTFRRAGELYRRGREVHCVRLFDTRTLCGYLAACGFTVETAQRYGSQPLLPRRRAFFATRNS
jgi:SAM-dependent methyltransferase